MELFKNPVVKKQNYEPRIRCKIDLAGKNQVRCWNEKNERCEMPSDLRGYKLVPRLTFSHLWFMSRECGFVVLVSDIQLLECPNEECPFEE